MYAYIELSNTARTDAVIRSLSWMNYMSSTPPLSAANDDNHHHHHRSIPSAAAHLENGWLATGNANHIVSVTFTSIKADEHLNPPDRTNFNLRAHRTEVRLVSWNVPYQKLATVDEKGVIFVWVKHDNRWSLELINDRSHPVTDMAWSPDGRMTVICYEDGFILAGSVTGQRYWSTVLNIPHAQISAVAWLPDMSHVILGTTAGQIFVMDHHGNTTEVFFLSTRSICQLMYSCNKFYPNAPDNNATRFVNDDYILACTLDNGQVLFLNNYQDQSPIVVETNLQNIKIDWSSLGEILAVGGHQRTGDLQYTNQIIFYSRRGELLHRTHIPQTHQPLSALSWAHGNHILFAACGSCVYTVWITHKSLPSMLTICQMKIKEYLPKNYLETFDSRYLPSNLRENLLRLYRSTIKGFLPDQNTIRSFVCTPLKSHLRLQCTMKRLDRERDTASIPPTATNNLSGAIYVLYLEYLGGLIPLLIAKRISKLCPDFIIFDPQMNTSDLSLSKLPPAKLLAKKPLLPFKSRPNTFQNIAHVQQSKIASTNPRSGLIVNRNSIYVAQTDVRNGQDDDTTATSTKNSDDCSLDDDSDDEQNPDVLSLHESQSRRKLAAKSAKHKHANKLCTIAANVWGTRFKFYGHSNSLPYILGSVTYKTSFLHLQPRQMTVTVANSSHVSRTKRIIQTKRMKNHLPKRTLLADQDDDNVPESSTAKPNVSSRIPIAPMSPQLQSILSQPFSSTVPELKHATPTRTHAARTSKASATTDSETLSLHLSRSTASIANCIRPIAPPCIQVKEVLSPKFFRASSATLTNDSLHRHCDASSMTNNIDMSTDVNHRDSTAHRSHLLAASSVLESCFEPEAYRSLSTLNSNQQKKLSFSDPTLYQPTDPVTTSVCSSQPTVRANEEIDTDNDEIENVSAAQETVLKEKIKSSHSRSRKRSTNPRHRIMTCTGGASDSLTRLSSLSDADPKPSTTDPSFHVMQNRPPLWNEQSQVYQLDFGGRVTLESAKNFQIEFKDKQVIQFGRIENNCYTLDFEWPFSPLQAFAVALANITQRLK